MKIFDVISGVSGYSKETIKNMSDEELMRICALLVPAEEELKTYHNQFILAKHCLIDELNRRKGKT